MKKILPVLLALFALVAILPATASAQQSKTYNGVTLLTTDQWTPLPNASNYVCNFSQGCGASFQWQGTVPGKDTTIRTVDCNGNETGRRRILGGSGALLQIGSRHPYAFCNRFQGRMPTESGNMANYHFYFWYWGI